MNKLIVHLHTIAVLFDTPPRLWGTSFSKLDFNFFNKKGVVFLLFDRTTKGGKGKLNPQDKQAVMQWLKTHSKWNLEKLRLYLEQEYGVIFNSLQSSYNLFKEAKITWKKTQKKNPKKNPDLVLEVREEIKKN